MSCFWTLLSPSLWFNMFKGWNSNARTWVAAGRYQKSQDSPYLQYKNSRAGSFCLCWPKSRISLREWENKSWKAFSEVLIALTYPTVLCVCIFLYVNTQIYIYIYKYTDTYSFLGVCTCNACVIYAYQHWLNFIQRENAQQNLTLEKFFFSVFTRLVSGRMWSVIAEATAQGETLQNVIQAINASWSAKFIPSPQMGGC